MDEKDNPDNKRNIDKMYGYYGLGVCFGGILRVVVSVDCDVVPAEITC